jgi:pimeloyl-ACP methyl ester carboxylesterase
MLVKTNSRFLGLAKATLSLIAFIAIFAVASVPAQSVPVKNIVLVHGAWADDSGWKGVYEILTKDHFNVSIVQEPETSFKDDVATTKRVLALQDGPCILVAHSYGGAVITEAGNDPSVAGLVYIAAHMPDAGEKESEDGKRFPSDLAKSSAIKKTPDGFTYIPRPVSCIIRRRPFSGASCIHGAFTGFQLRRQLLGDHYRCRLANKAQLGVSGGERSYNQP